MNFEDFMTFDIRVGTIIKVQPFPKARKSAFQLWVDFGDQLGIKRSSAQITELYKVEQLVGRQALAVVNFPPRQIADFVSEVLILGVYTPDGVVLIQPERAVKNGCRVG